MSKGTWMRLAAVCALAAGLGGCANQMQRGLSAYDRGDYAMALACWTPLADAGAAEAPTNEASFLAFAKWAGSPTTARIRATVMGPRPSIVLMNLPTSWVSILLSMSLRI